MVRAMAERAADDRNNNGRREVSLKVDAAEGDLVSKLAALRRVSIARLFKERDVNDFLTHLLLEEMRKETERLKGTSPPPPPKPKK
jgi:hypothetical protein